MVIGLPDVEGWWQSGQPLGETEAHQLLDLGVCDEDQDAADFKVDVRRH